MCCRIDSVNSASPNTPLRPAARFGDYGCDVPSELMLSMFDYMQPIVKNSSFAIFTGDVAPHDKAWQLSRDYQKYEEYGTLETFKAQLGGIPLFPTLGNHDSFPVIRILRSGGLKTVVPMSFSGNMTIIPNCGHRMVGLIGQLLRKHGHMMLHTATKLPKE